MILYLVLVIRSDPPLQIIAANLLDNRHYTKGQYAYVFLRQMRWGNYIHTTGYTRPSKFYSCSYLHPHHLPSGLAVYNLIFIQFAFYYAISYFGCFISSKSFCAIIPLQF